MNVASHRHANRSRRVEIIEVGPRDGLQNQPGVITVAEKVAFVDALSQVGFQRIEAGSFVSARWVPQMAGSGDVFARIQRLAGVKYLALAPNLRGASDAVAARADEIAVFVSASEGFSRANINASIEDSLARVPPLIDLAREADVPVRGYISCVTDCPYDGPVTPGAVLRVAERLRDIGCTVISLGDTIGQGTPERVDVLLDHLLAHFPAERLVGHFHDTAGRALENVAVCLERGLRTFDSSVAGLGGCPFAPGAAGTPEGPPQYYGGSAAE